MLVIGSVFVFAIGLFTLIKPELIYQLRESWKSSSMTEPSDLYLILMRISGGIFAVSGVAGFVLACMS